MRLNSKIWMPLPSGYYDSFPDRSMGVVIKVIKEPTEKKILVLDKDVKAGEVIFTVSTLSLYPINIHHPRHFL